MNNIWVGLYIFVAFMNIFVGILTWVTGTDQSLFSQVMNSFLVGIFFVYLASHETVKNL